MFNIMTNQIDDTHEISSLVNLDDWNNLKNFLNANSLDDVEVNYKVFY